MTIRYSDKLKTAIEDLRPAFREMGHSLETLTTKRAALAPAFMRTYAIWTRETHRPFIAFVHELDPRVPVNDRKAYRTHPSYRAAEYLKNLAKSPEKFERHGVTTMTMLVRTVRSLLLLYGDNQKAQRLAYDALLSTTRWPTKYKDRFFRRVTRAHPVALPNVPRLAEAMAATKAVLAAVARERQKDAAA